MAEPHAPSLPRRMNAVVWGLLMFLGGGILLVLVAGLVDFTLGQVLIDDDDVRELRRRFVSVGAVSDVEPTLAQELGTGQLGYVCNVNVLFGMVRGQACDLAVSNDGGARSVRIVPAALRTALLARHPLPPALDDAAAHVRPWPTLNR